MSSKQSTTEDYRLNYYQKNKEKIQEYQREYYQKKLKPKRNKPSKLHWKGEKINGVVFKDEKVIVKFD